MKTTETMARKLRGREDTIRVEFANADHLTVETVCEFVRMQAIARRKHPVFAARFYDPSTADVKSARQMMHELQKNNNEAERRNRHNAVEGCEQMSKHIYIAGPMKGLPEFNYPAFNSTEERLKKLGYNVVNPVKLSGEITPEELDANYDLLTSVMNKEQRSIAQCDSIYLLRGWEKSKGARKELAIAIMLNLEIILEERQDA